MEASSDNAESRRRVMISLAVSAVALVAALIAWGVSSEAWHGMSWDPDYIDQAFKETHHGDGLGYCSADRRPRYRDATLKTIHDAPVASLLTYDELKGERKFEASDVIHLGDYFYAICDSSWAVLRIHESQPLRSELNQHVGSPTMGYAEGESGFEGILYDPTASGLYVVRESVDISGDLVDDARRLQGLPAVTDDPSYHAVVMEIVLPPPDEDGADYAVVEACPSEFLFDGDSKGFEGAASLRGADGVLYLLGLCEGNDCVSGDHGKQPGRGKVVVMRHRSSGGPTGGCVWQTVRVLELPIEGFVDYSALALHKATKTVAITSQENSQVWIGTLSGGDDDAFDPLTAEFADLDDGPKVLDFPRDPTCGVSYCNVEGLAWVEGGGDNGTLPQVLVAVSDKMKKAQPFRCLEKDQSFHLFGIP